MDISFELIEFEIIRRIDQSVFCEFIDVSRIDGGRENATGLPCNNMHNGERGCNSQGYSRINQETE
jgi:hypothetical protein